MTEGPCSRFRERLELEILSYRLDLSRWASELASGQEPDHGRKPSIPAIFDLLARLGKDVDFFELLIAAHRARIRFEATTAEHAAQLNAEAARLQKTATEEREKMRATLAEIRSPINRAAKHLDLSVEVRQREDAVTKMAAEARIAERATIHARELASAIENWEQFGFLGTIDRAESNVHALSRGHAGAPSPVPVETRTPLTKASPLFEPSDWA